MQNRSEIFSVYTSHEASKLWGLGETTVRQWCNRGKFKDNEARKSEKAWLVSRAGMVRLTGREPSGTDQ